MLVDISNDDAFGHSLRKTFCHQSFERRSWVQNGSISREPMYYVAPSLQILCIAAKYNKEKTPKDCDSKW